MRDGGDFERLFDNTDKLLTAKQRRVAAIDANPRMAWVVQIATDGYGTTELQFDVSPDFATIQQAARAQGVLGYVRILGITATVVKERPLLLTPWMIKRKRA